MSVDLIFHSHVTQMALFRLFLSPNTTYIIAYNLVEPFAIFAQKLIFWVRVISV